MAWSLRASTPATGTSATTSYTITLGAACSVDDRVIVTASAESNGGTPAVTSITGTFCGTFTKDKETSVYVDGSFNAITSVWSAPVTSAGTPVLTVNQTGAAVTGSGAAAAYSGLDTSVGAGAVDVSSAAQANQPSSTTPSTTTATTTAANEPVIGGFGDDGETATFVAAGGLTRRAFLANGNADTAIMDKDSGATGTQTANCTGASANGWGAVAVVYKLAAAGGLPPGNSTLDTKTPRSITRFSPSQTTDVDGSEFWMLRDKFFAAAGEGPAYDYPNPLGWHKSSRAQPAYFLRFWNDEVEFWLKDTFYGAAGETKVYDYPNPRGAIRNIGLLSWWQALKMGLLGQDTFFGSAGMGPKYDYPPNPRLANWMLTRGTHVGNSLLTLLAAVVAAPFNLRNWPNPFVQRPRLRPQDFQDPSEIWMLKDTFFGAEGQPPANLDWPNPQRPIRNIGLWTWWQSLKANLIGMDALPFRALDWAVPRIAQPSIAIRTWMANLLENTLAPIISVFPFALFDWPNPRGATPSLDLRTWITNIIGTTLSLIQAIPFAQRLWPNPRAAKPNITLLTQNDPTKLLLRGQDTFFGAAGQPAHYDWPNPLQPRRSISLRGFIDALRRWLPVPVTVTDAPGHITLRTAANGRITTRTAGNGSITVRAYANGAVSLRSAPNGTIRLRSRENGTITVGTRLAV